MKIIAFILLPFIFVYIYTVKLFKKQCPYCRGLKTRFYRYNYDHKEYVCYECGQLF